MLGLVLQAMRHETTTDAPAAEASAAPALPPIRVGFTASRKVGGAVVRNRARRRLRAAAAQVLPMAATAHDYVLIARQGTLKRPFAALVEDLTTALKRMRAWTPDRETGS